MPADIVDESRRKPVVKGKTGVEIAGRLINQNHRTRRALRRSISLYRECRRT